MEQEMSLRDVANYLDYVGIQFLATIGLDGKPKVRPMQYNPIFKVFYLKNLDGWMTNLGHVKGLEKRDEFVKPIHFKF